MGQSPSSADSRVRACMRSYATLLEDVQQVHSMYATRVTRAAAPARAGVGSLTLRVRVLLCVCAMRLSVARAGAVRLLQVCNTACGGVAWRNAAGARPAQRAWEPCHGRIVALQR